MVGLGVLNSALVELGPQRNARTPQSIVQPRIPYVMKHASDFVVQRRGAKRVWQSVVIEAPHALDMLVSLDENVVFIEPHAKSEHQPRKLGRHLFGRRDKAVDDGVERHFVQVVATLHEEHSDHFIMNYAGKRLNVRRHLQRMWDGLTHSRIETEFLWDGQQGSVMNIGRFALPCFPKQMCVQQDVWLSLRQFQQTVRIRVWVQAERFDGSLEACTHGPFIDRHTDLVLEPVIETFERHLGMTPTRPPSNIFSLHADSFAYR